MRGLLRFKWMSIVGVAIVFSMVLFGCVGEDMEEGLITKAELVAKIADYFRWPHPTRIMIFGNIKCFLRSLMM